MNETKVVKIFPREYWKQDTESEYEYMFEVNNQKFYSELDGDIENCKMKEFFGTIQKIEIVSDSRDTSERPNYFIITDQSNIGNKPQIFEWDLCAIQEEYTKEEYPEFFL